MSTFPIQILRSSTYRNLHSTNQVSDGRRTITGSVNDTEQLPSGIITVEIDVGDRNDAPAVDLGAGPGIDLNVIFVENGPSVPIVLPHLVNITDEENHNISRITFQLMATNGKLDMMDAIFLRSPLAFQFIDDFRTPPTTTLIDISLNATTANYTDILLSVFYDNNEAEPTLYNDNGDLLNREVLITIYDANFLQGDQMNSPDSNFDDNYGVGVTMLRAAIVMETINDNRPRIVFRAEPDGCAQSSMDSAIIEESAARRRRDVKIAASKMKKRANRATDTSKVSGHGI